MDYITNVHSKYVLATSAYLARNVSALSKSTSQFTKLVYLNAHTLKKSELILPYIYLGSLYVLVHGDLRLSEHSYLKNLLSETSKSGDSVAVEYIDLQKADASNSEFSLDEAKLAIDISNS